MSISKGTEKSFDKIKIKLFIIKTLGKPGI